MKPKTDQLPVPSFANLERKLEEILEKSRSYSTAKKYGYSFKTWSEFVNIKGGIIIPSDPHLVALFLTHRIEQGDSFNTLGTYVYAIKWFNERKGKEFNNQHPHIRNVLEAAKRIMPRKKINRKDVITTDAIVRMCDKYKGSNDLSILRDLCYIVISFAGLLRFSEVVALKASNFKFLRSHCEIYIEKSKCDQYRDGHKIVLAHGKTSACPVSNTKKYFKAAKIEEGSEVYIFRKISKSRGKQKLIVGKHVCYSTMRKAIVTRLKSVRGNEGLDIGLHSLRASGATAAVKAGVSERCLKRHGRWKSDSAKDRYVEDSLAARLAVSGSMNL